MVLDFLIIFLNMNRGNSMFCMMSNIIYSSWSHDSTYLTNVYFLLKCRIYPLQKVKYGKKNILPAVLQTSTINLKDVSFHFMVKPSRNVKNLSTVFCLLYIANEYSSFCILILNLFCYILRYI